MKIEPLFYRVRQIVELTGLSKSKIFSVIKDGRLEARKLDGVVLIPRESLNKFLESAVPRRAAK